MAWDRKLVSAVKTGSIRDAQDLIERGIAELKQSRVPIETCFLQMQKVVLSLDERDPGGRRRMTAKRRSTAR